MIKRQYFLSSKVSHDNGTGDYSWLNTIINTKSWFENKDDLLLTCRELSKAEFDGIVERDLCEYDIQVLALNKL